MRELGAGFQELELVFENACLIFDDKHADRIASLALAP